MTAAIRTAHIARITAAWNREQVARSLGRFPAGMPETLMSAGIWLVANGWTGTASDAEVEWGYGPDYYRRYLATCNASERAEELEAGRAAIFDGRRAICPEPPERLAA